MKFFHNNDAAALPWMEIDEAEDFLAGKSSDSSYLWGPRVYAEQLRLRNWEEVVSLIETLPFGSWWFDDLELRFEGRRVFEYYVHETSKPGAEL